MSYQPYAPRALALCLGACVGLAAAGAAVWADGGAGGGGNAKMGVGAGVDANGAAALGAAVDRALGLKGSTLFEMPGAVDTTPGAAVRAEVFVAGRWMTLSLTPHSVRGPGYRSFSQGADGKLVALKPDAERTVRGRVEGEEGTLVAGSVLDDGLYAMIRLANGEQHWVEPVSGRTIWNGKAGRAAGVPALAQGTSNVYVSYRAGDVAPGPWHCGTPDGAFPGPDGDAGAGGGAAPQGPTLRGVNRYSCLLATDADYEYFASYGSIASVNARIALVINVMNVQYERDVDIQHFINGSVVRTAEPDPYTSTASGTMLSQLQADWNSNHPTIGRQVVQLFTGKDVDGNIIGLSPVGYICPANAGCLVQSDFDGNLASASDLSAHELGHSWGAPHCTCASPAYTMNPFITSINRFLPGGDIPTIIGYRNGRACISSTATGNTVANDVCANAELIGPGTIAISNVQAGTEFLQTGQCATGAADVWYRFPATCDGNVTIDLCAAGYDSTVMVFTSCPGSGAAVPIGCNDDFTGCGLGSKLTFAAARGTTYYVRVGGYLSATGSGTMTVSTPYCPPPSNNSCSSPLTVHQGTTGFDNRNATQDGPYDTAAGCQAFSYGQSSGDLWYLFAPECTGSVTVTTCGSTFDTKLTVYGGSAPCGALTAGSIACNDDSCGVQSSLSFAGVAGSFYTIRVGGYNGATGTGVLNITSAVCPPQANDQCASAAPVAAGGTYTGNTAAAGLDGAASCGSSTTGPDVWFSYTTPYGGTLRLDTCTSGFDTVLSVHSGCPGNASNQVAGGCNDDSPPTGPCYVPAVRSSYLTVAVTAGSTSRIRLGGFNGVSGAYVLHVGFVPAGDACADAVAIGNGTFSGTTVGAGPDGVDNDCVFNTATAPGVWYRYTAPCTGTVSADLCGSPFDTALAVYPDGCPVNPAGRIACNDDSNSGSPCSPSTNSALSFSATAGTAYLIRVGGYNGQSGAYTLHVACAGVGNPCPADWNVDGEVNGNDISDYINSWYLDIVSGTTIADFNGDGETNGNDISDYINAWYAAIVNGGYC